MEVKLSACPGCTGDRTDPATDYRVVLWEQPDLDNIPSESIGWGEVGFDLTGVSDVNEALDWAERQLAEGAGHWSRKGHPVRDREFVVYARVPGEGRLIQVAGWDPSRNPSVANLARAKRHS